MDWPVPVGKTTALYVFTVTSGAPRSLLCTITILYGTWKTFIHESKFRSRAKFISDEVTRCGNFDLSLTLGELESFIA